MVFKYDQPIEPKEECKGCSYGRYITSPYVDSLLETAIHLSCPCQNCFLKGICRNSCELFVRHICNCFNFSTKTFFNEFLSTLISIPRTIVIYRVAINRIRSRTR